MKGYIGHTDAGWWHFLRAQGQDAEANFWRPGGRRFSALSPGEPFFFRLKSPINRIGGFGLFARYASLPVWRVWEVFGPANGVTDEQVLLDRVNRFARRTVQLSDSIGCVAVAHCNFFPEDDWLDVPPSFNPQNLSGSVIDLAGAEGRRLWSDCLDRAASVSSPADWLVHAIDRERYGKPQIVLPRLGQGSFRIAVMEAYNNGCAVTGEHSMPALEAAHIRPWAQGGTHEISNGLPLRRDLHRLFDLGYISARPDGRLLVSPRLRSEFANGRTYYALEGQPLRAPEQAGAEPTAELLRWHSETVFQTV